MAQHPDYAPIWQWVREREAIRARKASSAAWPWTDDPILAAYRFCCVRREDDRVTSWIRRHVREPYRDHPLLWWMLCACRQINWPGTIAELISAGAWPDDDSFSPECVAWVLTARKNRGDKVYTGAYLIPGPPQKGEDKQAYVANLVLGNLYRRAQEFGEARDWEGRTLQHTHQMIRRSRGWGDFLAYQAVVDMRFSDRLLAEAPDRETWAAAGPGTIRGLNRIHGRETHSSLSQGQALAEMRAIYERVEAETGVPVDFSDVPNLLCETDKYLRVLRGEGRPRARYVPGRGA